MFSLRTKLIAPFVMGTLALTLLLAWYTYTSARQAVEEAMLLISEAKTSHTVSSMSLLFKSTASTMQNMVADPNVTGLFSQQEDVDQARKKTSGWLEIIAQNNEYYRDIIIVDKHGYCIASSNPGLIGTYYGDRSYVRQALQGMFSYGESSVGRVSKRFNVISAGPVDAGDGIVGALIIVNDFPRIVDYDTVGTNDTQIIFTSMLNREGLFVAHKDKTLMGNEQKLFPELYQQLAAVGKKGGTVEYTLLGNSYIGYAKMETASNWVVVNSGLKSEVFAPAYRIGLMVLGISFVFLCGISLLVIRFSNGILSSLLSLIQYAKRVSEGDLDLHLQPTDRQDELGVLHNALSGVVSSLRVMLQKTQEASKMKGEFLANMSHEIRTPLNAIIGMTHLSLRDGDLSTKQRDYLDKIQLAAKSLLGLINDILDISKVEAGMLSMDNTTFNLRETVKNILAIHQETAQTKGLSLIFEYQPETPDRFIGDPLRIGQILNNLLGNAIKFTPAGGITVRCSQENTPETDGHIVMHLSVTDTGIGIAQDVIATLFQPFTQADASITRKFGGTGLGLAISDRLVSLMGGKLTVTSEEGRGTTFEFSLRLKPDTANNAEHAEDIPLDLAFQQLGLQGKHILVAEDNSLNQLILNELLTPSGAEISMANNGREAVEAVIARDFDLVFMDMQMPVMGGLEATRIIRGLDRARNLPIIAVTANAMSEDKNKGFACGMNDYLTKPIEPSDLLKVLRTWLVERQS